MWCPQFPELTVCAADCVAFRHHTHSPLGYSTLHLFRGPCVEILYSLFVYFQFFHSGFRFGLLRSSCHSFLLVRCPEYLGLWLNTTPLSSSRRMISSDAFASLLLRLEVFASLCVSVEDSERAPGWMQTQLRLHRSDGCVCHPRRQRKPRQNPAPSD